MKNPQNFFLHAQDDIFGEAVVADASHNRLHEEGRDIFVLACEEHAGDAEYMQLVESDAPRHLTDEAVHELDGEEESLATHVEGGKHLEHPIDHACAANLSYAMPRQMRLVLGLSGRTWAPTVHS